MSTATVTLSSPMDTSSSRRSVSTLNNARTLPPLRIPDLEQGDAPSPVPFPRISQRRKLVRGVGTQPWHNKGSSDSDSDSDSAARKAAATKPQQPKLTILPHAHPNPEAMPNFDPKRTYSESQISTNATSPSLSPKRHPRLAPDSQEEWRGRQEFPQVASHQLVWFRIGRKLVLPNTECGR